MLKAKPFTQGNLSAGGKKGTNFTKFSLSSLIIGLSLSLTGCGSGSSGEAEMLTESAPIVENSPTESGQVMIVLRDDEDDFLSYDIDVLSIDLVRKDGSQVSVTPTSARVDFIQYADISELFSINTLPTGEYTEVAFTLDYSTASIVIQDELGQTYDAIAQDTQGQVLTNYSLSLMLSEDEPLVIRRNALATMTLDLDLATSNQVLSFEPAIVQVEPFVHVSISTDETREHRVRGLLQGLDSETNTAIVNVKPMRKKSGEFGELTVTIDDETVFEINGEVVANIDGMATLALLPLDSPFVAYGGVDENKAFTANEILAGSSVEWAGKDGFRGVVTARSADSITVSGVVLSPEDQQAVHSQAFTLNLSETTQFTGFKQQALSAASLSTGQHIKAIGSFDDETTFDANDGIVQIKLSQLTGQVVQVDPLVVDVTKINRKPVTSYNFSGTGLTEEQDADVDFYEIAHSLSSQNVATDDWITLRGHVSEYGQAPADFTAKALIKKDLSAAHSHLKVKWPDGTASVTVDSEAGTISWLADDARQKVTVRGMPGNLAEQTPVSSITSDREKGRFALKLQGEKISYFAVYSDFIAALSLQLAEGGLVSQITSKGMYDAEVEGIKAVAVSINLQ